MRRKPEALKRALAELDAQHLRRYPGIAVDSELDFSSNDYLGLRHHPAVRTAMADCALSTVAGAGASHLISGHHAAHDALEHALAEFTGYPAALVFSTGYMANLGVLTALLERDDLLLQDRLNHASLIDAGLLARVRESHRYPHANAAAARERLQEFRQRRGEAAALLATDGVFSMDGDVAPLAELAAACHAHEAWLVVDDAHGIGVIGADGRGSLEHHGLKAADVPVLIGTFGKALGTFGAFVAGDKALLEWLLQRARTYIYTTALPPPVAAATTQALQLVTAEKWRREKLAELIGHFKDGAARRGLSLLPSDTPIQPLVIGDVQRTLAASHALRARGLRVTAIRPPTVPNGSARLRVTLSARHERPQLDMLLDALSASLEPNQPATELAS